MLQLNPEFKTLSLSWLSCAGEKKTQELLYYESILASEIGLYQKLNKYLCLYDQICWHLWKLQMCNQKGSKATL